MRVYSGTGGEIWVRKDKNKPRMLKPQARGFSWGDPSKVNFEERAAFSDGCTATARAILADVLDNESRANRIAMRYKHRVIALLPNGQDFVVTEPEVMTVVAEIEKAERDTAQTRRMVALEPAPIMSDQGRDITWTKEPKLKANLERKDYGRQEQVQDQAGKHRSDQAGGGSRKSSEADDSSFGPVVGRRG